MSATHQPSPLAKLEQKTVRDLILKGKRIDDRGLMDYRPLTIMLGTIEKANGSAQVYLGKTKVLAGVKVQVGTPFPDTPNEGILTVNTRNSFHLRTLHLKQARPARIPSSLRESLTAEYVNRKP